MRRELIEPIIEMQKQYFTLNNNFYQRDATIVLDIKEKKAEE